MLHITYLGSLEVQIATMAKTDRTKTDEVYVCGFVPSYALPNKMAWSLDPFLHPLVTELEDAFIDGIRNYLLFSVFCKSTEDLLGVGKG